MKPLQPGEYLHLCVFVFVCMCGCGCGFGCGFGHRYMVDFFPGASELNFKPESKARPNFHDFDAYFSGKSIKIIIKIAIFESFLFENFSCDNNWIN